MENKNETYTVENELEYSNSENIFIPIVEDDTISNINNANYYSISNKKNGVSLSINIRNEENKIINKRINR